MRSGIQINNIAAIRALPKINWVPVTYHPRLAINTDKELFVGCGLSMNKTQGFPPANVSSHGKGSRSKLQREMGFPNGPLHLMMMINKGYINDHCGKLPGHWKFNKETGSSVSVFVHDQPESSTS